MSIDEWSEIRHRLMAKLPSDGYRLVFDPWEDKDVVEASLADDIADIYQDLKDVLAVSGGKAKAWDWRFQFDQHWGQHAIQALYAIHWLRP